MNSNLEYFENKKNELTALIEAKEKINRRYSSLRLISFLFFFIFLIVYFVKHLNPLFLILAVIAFAVFVCLCVFHSKLKSELNHLKTLLEVNINYINRINGDFSALKDKGDEFFDKDHAYALDLDLFGPVSLFSLYNVSHTAFGRELFAQNLKGLDLPSDITLSQEAVGELIGMPDVLTEYEATSIEGNINKKPKALMDLYKNKTSVSKASRLSLKLLPLLWLIPVLVLVFMPAFIGASVLFVLIINTIIWFISSSKYAFAFKSVEGVSRQAEAFYKLFLILESKEFKSSYLAKLVKGGASSDKKASDGLVVLSKACSLASLRSQPILALILNSIFPFDVYCADKLLSWSVNYGEELEKSINSLAQIEVLMCASTVGLISSESVFPKVTEGAYFEGENIKHPLLNPLKAVSNSIKLDKELALITGSNMSGKTTLIRTVGICSVLAYFGAPVPASSCVLGKMRIMSSMRIVDSIEEQMSTFRAELVRIGKIVEAAKNDDSPMLFLIDEIFRGTNSQDRTDGALAVLKNLDKSYITGLMTTHDYALCDKVQETVSSVVYYHFSEVYNDNDIIFDYKLHDGVSHKSNAKFLMKLVGIE